MELKSEWKTRLLSDIAQFKNGKKRPMSKGSIPVYGGNGILSFTDQSNFENCVVIGRVGAYCGNVFYEPGKIWVSDNAIAALSRNNADIVYVYYLLRSLELNRRCIGTGQPLLTQNILNNIEVCIPDLQIQRKIANVLSAFDRKIELNKQINNHLAA